MSKTYSFVIGNIHRVLCSALVLIQSGGQFAVAQPNNVVGSSVRVASQMQVSPPVRPKQRTMNGVIVKGTTYYSPAPDTLNIDGQEFQTVEAIPVLMELFRDDHRPSKDRINALRTLSRLGPALRKTKYITELCNYYPACDEKEVQLAILGVVAGSLDIRGLAVFSSVIEHEDDRDLRLAATAALAGWNIRSGVRTLVSFLDSEAMLSETQPLSWIILRWLEDLDNLKKWGFPMEDVRLELATIADEKTRWTSYRQHWKEWFTRNEHRFPDWRPGDPLPKVVETNANTGDNK